MGRSVVWQHKALHLFGLIIMILAGLSACSSQSNIVLTGQPIKIGASLSSSGDFSEDGQAMLQGYQLWADAVNQSGGLLGRPVQLVILRDNSDPTQVAANYVKLITVDHVDMLFGPFSTLLTKAVAPVAQKYGYPLLEGAGGGPSVFTNGWTNTFDVSLPVASNMVSFALYVLSLPKAIRPTTAAYATENDPFTQPQIDLARSMLEQGGITTLYYKAYDAADTKAYATIANGLVHANAQIVLAGTLLPDLTTIIQTFQKQHYSPQMLAATAGPDQGNDFVKAVGGIRNTEGIMVPNGWYPQVTNFENAQMVQAYVAKYGGSANNINSDVAEAYSVGQVAQQAVTKVGGLSNSALLQELHTDTFNTVQGSTKFDKTGQNTLALPYLFQWQNGTLVPVYPDSIAIANPEFRPAQWV